MPGVDVFFDTNVLVYAVEGGGGFKQQKARELLREGDFGLSIQVLNEFCNVVTSPRRPNPLSHEEAVAWLQIWKRAKVQPLDIAAHDQGVVLADRFQIHVYDAMILAAARKLGRRLVLTEDLNHGQVYDGVEVVNPFLAG